MAPLLPRGGGGLVWYQFVILLTIRGIDLPEDIRARRLEVYRMLRCSRIRYNIRDLEGGIGTLRGRVILVVVLLGITMIRMGTAHILVRCLPRIYSIRVGRRTFVVRIRRGVKRVLDICGLMVGMVRVGKKNEVYRLANVLLLCMYVAICNGNVRIRVALQE